jgi:ABC-type branched-subunit amino acid transport system ATPase component
MLPRGPGSASAAPFQLTNIFPSLTVLENVRLAVQARRGLGFNAWRSYRSFPDLEDRAWELLEAVLLETRWQAPAGLLAHGEKRKLELGILLALEPELLLLDEPTAGMALEEVPAIIGLIEGIKARRDKTILLVEHKIDMVMALSDSIAVLKDGRLIADGIAAGGERRSRRPGGLLRRRGACRLTCSRSRMSTRISANTTSCRACPCASGSTR